MRPHIATDADTRTPDHYRRRNWDARTLIADYAILTGAQRAEVIATLDADLEGIIELYAEVKRLERERERERKEAAAPTTEPKTAAPAAGHAEFAAEVGRLRQDHDVRRLEAEVDGLIAERDRLREQLNQRDQEITKRRARNRELLAEQGTMRVERDKAVHNLGREHARAERYRADTIDAEQRLRRIDRVLNEEPNPPTPARSADDTWQAFIDDRAELADQLAATPGPVHVFDTEHGRRPFRIIRDHNTGQDHHVYDHDTAEQTPEFRRWNPDHPRPTQADLEAAGLVPLEQLRDQVDGLIAERTPGPRPGPTPAVPPPHSPSGHMIGRCWCQTADTDRPTPAELADAAGYPYAPDYTEADLDNTREH